MIKVHDILVPQNNTFPLAETNDIRGSAKIVDNIALMYAMDLTYILPGTFCYVKDDDVYYKYYSGSRIFIFEIYGIDTTTYSINTNNKYAHLNQFINILSGDSLTFSGTDFIYNLYSRTNGTIQTGLTNTTYTFSRSYSDVIITASRSDEGTMNTELYEVSQAISMAGPTSIVNEWINVSFSNIYVGDTAPQYADAIWVDTASGKNPVIPTPLDELQQLVNEVNNLKLIVNTLSLLITSGVRAGDATIGNNVGMSIDDFTGLTSNNIPYTVTNISIKYDTFTRLNANKRNFINGELVYATDQGMLYICYNNLLLAITNNNLSAGNIMERAALRSSAKGISENIEEFTEDPEITSITSDINKGLRIISAFACHDINLNAAVTHNFIELGNYSDKSIDLSGLYIVYKDSDKTVSKELLGTIAPGNSYIIRGNRCSYSSNITMEIDEYDLDWNIAFDEVGSDFFIVYNPNNITKKVTAKGKTGYIDNFNVSGYTNIFFKKHSLNEKYADKDEITYIDISKIQLHNYYDIADILRIKPRYNKSLISAFNINKPNCINDTIGEFGTVSLNNKAERYITWISVGCYDEFIIIEDSNGNKKKIISTYDKWVYNNEIVTTHRVYLNKLEAGVYNFYIWRNDEYISDNYTFRIFSDDEIDQESMTIGISSNTINDNFTDIIKKRFIQNVMGTHFTINTAGATTNDEISQWIDYVNATVYTDIPVRNSIDSIENLNRFYTFNKPYTFGNKTIEDIIGFNYGNYYILIIGNNDVNSEELNAWIKDLSESKYVIVFTERKDIKKGNMIYNHINEKECKVITSYYKETQFEVEDDIKEKIISLEEYYTNNIFNENLI